MNKCETFKKIVCYLLSGLTVLSSGGNFLAQSAIDGSIKQGIVQNVKPKGKKSSVILASGSTAVGTLLGLLGGYCIFGRNNVPANEGHPDLSQELNILYNPPKDAYTPRNAKPQEFAKVRALYEANPNVNVGENFDIPVEILTKSENLPKQTVDNKATTKFTLTTEDSLTAGINVAERHGVNLTSSHDVAVLNFGNAQRPGGSVVLTGPTAQEESLCCNTLLFYTLVKAWHNGIFYLPNLIFRGAVQNPWQCNVECSTVEDLDEHDGSISSHGILSRNVPILNNHAGRLSISNQNMNFFTFAAPKISTKRYTKEEGWKGEHKNFENRLHDVMYYIYHTLFIAATYYGIKKLVIGAMGCGVFNCDPNTVADAARLAYSEFVDHFGYHFDEIVIAIKTDKPNTDQNYLAFKEQFNDLINPNSSNPEQSSTYDSM